MDDIIFLPMLSKVFQRIRLDEFERVVRHWLYIHTSDIREASAVIAHRCSTSSTE